MMTLAIMAFVINMFETITDFGLASTMQVSPSRRYERIRSEIRFTFFL